MRLTPPVLERCGTDLKRFFDVDDSVPMSPAADAAVGGDSVRLSSDGTAARIAVYDTLAAAPRVEEIAAESLADAIEQLASRTYNIAREHGGTIPYTIIREVSENLIHAGFREVVVTILDGGTTVRFADQGPGIPDKEKVFQPGFSTATAAMKHIIRGVGSGLPIVRETLTFAGGTIEIEDNLGNGTVVTLRSAVPEESTVDSGETEQAVPALTDRQKQALSIILELGSVGPSALSRELDVGVATEGIPVLANAGKGGQTTELGEHSLRANRLSGHDLLLGTEAEGGAEDRGRD